MTAEDSKEGAADSTPSGVASEPDDQRSDADRKSYNEEGERDLENPEVDVSLANPAQLEQTRGEEQSQRVEKEEGLVVEHGGTDPYGAGGETKEEEEDCPFCLYMKSGACGESFENWEECINEGEKTGADIVEKCVRVTRLLSQCMRANADYYGPILEAKKAAIASADGLAAAAHAEAERTEREAVEAGAQDAAQEAQA